jgi:ATP-binding cassette subfamily B protein
MTCRAFVIVLILIVSFSSSIILGLEIVVFSIIMGFISYKFFPKIKKTQEEIKKETDLQVKTTTENLTGIREIKALGVKENIKDRLYLNIDRLFASEKKQSIYELVYHNSNNFIYFVLQAVILITSGYFVFKGTLAYSIFVVIEAYIWRIDDVVESISDFGINYNKVKVSLKRIDNIVNNRTYEDEKFGNKEIKNPKGIIEFKNVSFKYRKEEDYTLKDFSIKIEPNKKIAIVGRSGNGKSTIFNLLLRYFDSTKGNIYLDGINIKDLTEDSLRSNISIIRQAPFLFNLSIMDNFRIVKKDII